MGRRKKDQEENEFSPWEYGLYDEYGYDHPAATPKRVENGIKAKSRRGKIGETWWSQRWVDLLESYGLGDRLTRGRSYARRGQVISLEVKPGLATAKVQGSRSRPYTVKLRLEPFSARDWRKITGAMASRAVFAAKLLAGEMPQDIEEAFQEAEAPLFPDSLDDLDMDCSCPDWYLPCKHVIAVHYLLAERFDADPFLLFTLRGRTKEEIITALRERRSQLAAAAPAPVAAGAAADAAASEPETLESLLPSPDNPAAFWQAGEALASFAVKLDTLAELEQNSTEETKWGNILLRLGTSPFTVRGWDLSFILAKAYQRISLEAVTRAREVTEDGAKADQQSC